MGKKQNALAGVEDGSKLHSALVDISKILTDIRDKQLKAGGPDDKATIVKDRAAELSDHMFGGLKTMQEIIERVPILGGIFAKKLNIGGLLEYANEKIHAVERAYAAGKISAAKKALMLGKIQASTYFKAFTNPYMLLIQAAKIMVDRFIAVDAAAEDFRKNTGLVDTQMGSITKEVTQINVQFARMGVSIAEAFKAAAAIVKTFQVASVQTGTLMKNTALMAANLGIAEEDTTKTFKLFLGMSGMSTKMSNNATALTARLSELGGVAPAEVFKDLASASNDVVNFVGKTPKQLILSTIEARRLGTTIESIAKSARGMVDFQGSINAEMEASVLIGRNMNFQLSRQLAWEGKVVESREEALRQIELAGDWDKKNVLQREAMAKAANMEVADVTKMMAQKKLLNNLSADGLAMYQQMQKEAEDLKNLDDDRATAAADAYVLNMKRQSEMKKLKDSLTAGMTALGDALQPIAKILLPIVKIVGGVLVIALRFIGAILRGFLAPLEQMFERLKVVTGMSDMTGDAFETILSLADKIGAAIGLISGSIAFLLSLAEAGGKFALWVKHFNAIQTVVDLISGSLLWIGNLASRIIRPFVTFFGFIGKIGGIGAKIGPVLGFVLRIGSIFLKWVPILGWIIMGIQFIFSLVKRLISGEGFGSALGGALYDTLLAPFVDAWNWIKGIFIGHSPSKIGAGIVKGIEAIQDMLFDALLWPFKTAWDFIGKIFGIESLGTKIVGVFKRILSIIRTMFNPVAWIGKMLSSDSVTAKVQASSPTQATATETAKAPENSAIAELAKAVIALTEKVDSLSKKTEKSTDESSASKLQELIELFKSGGIAVHMDGRKVSDQLKSAN